MSNEKKYHYGSGKEAFIQEFIYRVFDTSKRTKNGVSLDFMRHMMVNYYGGDITQQDINSCVRSKYGVTGDQFNFKMDKRWDKFTRLGKGLRSIIGTKPTWSFNDIPDSALQKIEERLYTSGKYYYSLIPSHWPDYEQQSFADIKILNQTGAYIIDFKKEIYDVWKGKNNNDVEVNRINGNTYKRKRKAEAWIS